MRQEQDDLFCRIYVDGIEQPEELTQLLSSELEGQVVGAEIQVGRTMLAVRPSDDYDPQRRHDPLDGFIHFPLNIELAALADQDRAAHIAVTRQTLEALWSRRLTAVASCDYERALPHDGYNSRSAP